jgi:small subunit ribosomal protein S4
MSRYTGPKRRLSRREGVPLFTKDAAILERKGAIPPGQRGTRMRRRSSEYGVQLREKQKAKRLFGLTEKQFLRVYQAASKKKGATGQTMLEILESRLDNVVYRLGFTSSRMEARQIVNHGHITVDNKRVSIPSYQVKPGSVIAVAAKYTENVQVQKNIEATTELPEWVERKASVGKMVRIPKRDEMEQVVNEQLIVEYYSR